MTTYVEIRDDMVPQNNEGGLDLAGGYTIRRYRFANKELAVAFIERMRPYNAYAAFTLLDQNGNQLP